MGTCKYVYGRHVWVKRVASLCGVFVLLPLAGCSSESTRFGYDDARGGYGATGSVPVPSEPVYSYRNSYDNGYSYGNGYTNSTAQYSGNSAGAYRDGSYSRAPFASYGAGAYQPQPVQRSSLAPAGGPRYGAYERYAANTTSGVKNDAYAGGSFAMMAVDTTASPGGAKSNQRMAYDDYQSRQRGRDDYEADRYPRDRYGDGDLKNREYLGDDRTGRYEDRRDTRPRSQDYAREDDYVVQPGDTIYGIAQRFHLTTDQLMTLNDMRTTDIQPGQRLRVAGYGYTGTNRQDASTRRAPEARNGYDDYGSDYRNDGRNGYRNDGRGSDYPKSRSYGNRSNGNGDSGGNGQNGYGQGGYGSSNAYGYGSNNAYGYGQNSYDNSDDRRGGYAPGRTGYTDETAAPAPRYGARPSGDYARDPREQNNRRDAVRYSVKRGDTVFDIARRNGISHRELADFNGIGISDKLMPGQLLLIPRGKGYDWNADRLPPENSRGDRWSAKQPQPQPDNGASRNAPRAVAENRGDKRVPPKPERAATVAVIDTRQDIKTGATGGPGARNSVASGEPVQVVSGKHEETSAPVSPADGAKIAPRECESLLANPAPRSAKTFREPVQGMIVTKFGQKEDGSFSDGINFSVPKGTPVKAAENGVVAYAGDELSGFGNLVLIRHADGYVSAYANNDELSVGRCDVVKRGQIIGKAGATGNATKPQLHFELRKDSKPVDPEAFFSRS